jgi:hypothetical protein
VSVAIATRFLDEAATRPIVHQCGDYQGTANDVMVTVSCLEEREGADIEGYTGYAIYAQFHGDVANQDAAICQMDIVLYDSTYIFLSKITTRNGATYRILWLQSMPTRKAKI